ncbi:MAG: hypothetical protein ACKPKO_22155, partial [Candidatus Fonsibacter sp.]
TLGALSPKLYTVANTAPTRPGHDALNANDDKARADYLMPPALSRGRLCWSMFGGDVNPPSGRDRCGRGVPSSTWYR